MLVRCGVCACEVCVHLWGVVCVFVRCGVCVCEVWCVFVRCVCACEVCVCACEMWCVVCVPVRSGAAERVACHAHPPAGQPAVH